MARIADDLSSWSRLTRVPPLVFSLLLAVLNKNFATAFPQLVENQPVFPLQPENQCLPPFECVELCRCRKDDIVETGDPLAIITIKRNDAFDAPGSDFAAARECFKDTGFLQDGTEKVKTGLCKDAAAVCCTEPLPPKPTISLLPSTSTERQIDPSKPAIPSGDWTSCGIAPAVGPGYEIKFTQAAANGAIPGIDFTEAKPWEFPWTAVILEKFKNKSLPTGEPLDVFVGTGSIIHPSVVLTAATKLLRFKSTPSKELNVRVGIWDLTSTSTINSNVPHQDLFVQKIIFHPEFKPRGQYENNLALLVLEKPILPFPNVAKICLPERSADLLTDFDQTCVATGFGTYVKGKTSIMKKAYLQPVGHNTCIDQLREALAYPQFFLHDGSTCAIGNNGLNDTCRGDGGGPLMCRDITTGAWTQIGITAWGVKCDGGVPGVYTNVAYFADWINESVELNTGRERKIESLPTIALS